VTTDERRLILDRSFERAMETVLDSFLREGFTLKPLDAGDLRQPQGCSLRYALLEAELPELNFRGVPSASGERLLACRLSLYELTDACTLVTAENPLVRYPLLSSLAPRVGDRIGHALRTAIRAGVLTAA
jgi:hypothetical protein